MAFLMNFPEAEKVNYSNDWVANPLQINGFAFFTFNKTKGGLSQTMS